MRGCYLKNVLCATVYRKFFAFWTTVMKIFANLTTEIVVF